MTGTRIGGCSCVCNANNYFSGADCSVCTSGSNGLSCNNGGIAQGISKTITENIASCSCKCTDYYGGPNCGTANLCTVGLNG